MRHVLGLVLAGALSACALATHAQETEPAPQITMGNGEANSIQLDGLTLSETPSTFSEVRVDAGHVTSFRAHSAALTFSEVIIEQNGWLVLHPVIDGRPDGDMVSGYAYVAAGENEDVTVRLDHPAKTGDRFLVMLHQDVDEDRVFDFVFVEDGINVEDRAVFEGTHMIAHVFAVP
ncbi:MAG: DUF7282 domain-containing protein [Henriciella sp.]|nr:hypothetical protein [Hyphomonadaceae bacterium]